MTSRPSQPGSRSWGMWEIYPTSICQVRISIFKNLSSSVRIGLNHMHYLQRLSGVDLALMESEHP